MLSDVWKGREIGRLVRGDGETNFGEIVSEIVRGG